MIALGSKTDVKVAINVLFRFSIRLCKMSKIV